MVKNKSVRIQHGKLSLEKELLVSEDNQLDLDAGAAHRAIDPGVIIIDGMIYYTNKIKDPTTICLDRDKYLRIKGIGGRVLSGMIDTLKIRGVKFELYKEAHQEDSAVSVQEPMPEPALETDVVEQYGKEQLKEGILVEIRAQLEEELRVEYENKIMQLRQEYEGQLGDMVEQVRVLKEEMEEDDRAREEIVQKQRHLLEEYRKIQEQSNNLPEIQIEDVEEMPEIPVEEMVKEIRTLRLEIQDLKEKGQGIEGKNMEYLLSLEGEKQRNYSLSEENRSLRQQILIFENNQLGVKDGQLEAKIKELEEQLKLEFLEKENFKRNLEEARKKINESEVTKKGSAISDNQEILGAVAYVLDKLFFSRMIDNFKQERMEGYKIECVKELETEVNKDIRWDLKTDDFTQYSKVREDYIRENLPKKLEIKSKLLTQDVCDLYIQRQVEKGKVFSILQNIRSGKNFREILTLDKEILNEFFDSLHIYALDSAKNNELSMVSTIKGSNIINRFLLAVYEIMRVKGGVLSYPALAENYYKSISEKGAKPIFGRKLKNDDIKAIIELANRDISGFESI